MATTIPGVQSIDQLLRQRRAIGGRAVNLERERRALYGAALDVGEARRLQSQAITNQRRMQERQLALQEEQLEAQSASAEVKGITDIGLTLAEQLSTEDSLLRKGVSGISDLFGAGEPAVTGAIDGAAPAIGTTDTLVPAGEAAVDSISGAQVGLDTTVDSGLQSTSFTGQPSVSEYLKLTSGTLTKAPTVSTVSTTSLPTTSTTLPTTTPTTTTTNTSLAGTTGNVLGAAGVGYTVGGYAAQLNIGHGSKAAHAKGAAGGAISGAIYGTATLGPGLGTVVGTVVGAVAGWLGGDDDK